MLVVISPAKTLRTDKNAGINSTMPVLVKDSVLIAEELKKLTVWELENLMKISPKLARLNYERIQMWHYPYEVIEGFNPVYTFNGEVYNGLDVDTLEEEDLSFANIHLNILSGFYGVLRPFDSILPYRLEMGTKLKVGDTKNLYDFWKGKITKVINENLKKSGSGMLINLASDEYFKSIDLNALNAKVVTPVFKDNKNGVYKVISIYAKKARGLMTRFIIKNRISNPDDLKLFDFEGYYYNENLSDHEGTLVFTRG